MAVVSNPLLQLSSAVTAPVTSVNPSSKVLDDSSDKASSFADLYAKHTQEQHAAAADVASHAAASKVAQAPKDVPAAKDKSVADKPAVADSGKALPAKADKTDRTDKSVKSDKDSGKDKTDATAKADASDKTDQTQDTDATDPVAKTGSSSDDDDADDSDDTLAATDIAPAPAATDPTLAPVAATPVVPVVDASATPAALDPSIVASLVPPPTPAALPAASATTAKTDVDPAPDALADLPAVRLALEQSAKDQGTTSAHAKSANSNDASATTNDPTLVNGLAVQLNAQQSSDASGNSKDGDKGFASIIDDGLKDIKGASADTRVDNFANRLQSLTDATTAKTTATTASSPLAQPLVMSQSGWTEGVVNRVMYLSSQNLKSADIELSPAELGKLNITVNMSPDQQTQVTFVSAHVGVREALDSQQSRLKEMFAQQGLGQMDVNVSDQSRNSQGQQQQAQEASRSASRSGGSAGGSSDDSVDDSVSSTAAVSQSVVIGSSAVDYYA